MSTYSTPGKAALVCGAGGFIGHHLVKRLKREGFWVRGTDLKFPRFSETEADDFVIGTGETYGDFSAALFTHNSCIGNGFLGPYVLPFELASFVLLGFANIWVAKTRSEAEGLPARPP
jgi:hypothetical protein